MKGSVVVMRNLEDVFEFLRQPENLIDKERSGWINFDTAGPVGAGSTFNANFKLGPVAATAHYEVTIYERPYKLAFLITPPPKELGNHAHWPFRRRDSPKVPPMEDVIDLSAAPGGTRITRRFQTRSRNPITWVLGIPFSPLANWGMRRDLRRLKTRIESTLR